MNEPCHTYEWAMSHIWMSHVTHMNESCRTYEWAMSHIWMSHVTHTNEPCRTYEWVMSHIRMSHVTHMNESCHTYEWVMSHIWMSHVRYEWVTSHISTSHVTHMNESCRIWISHVSPHGASVIRAFRAWLLIPCSSTPAAENEHRQRCDQHILDMTHLYVSRDSFVCETLLILYVYSNSVHLHRWNTA